jgi:hypothetical protein
VLSSVIFGYAGLLKTGEEAEEEAEEAEEAGETGEVGEEEEEEEKVNTDSRRNTSW